MDFIKLLNNKIMKPWTASDVNKVEEIKIALLQLEKEHNVSFSEEMEWLDKLKYICPQRIR